MAQASNLTPQQSLRAAVRLKRIAQHQSLIERAPDLISIMWRPGHCHVAGVLIVVATLLVGTIAQEGPQQSGIYIEHHASRISCLQCLSKLDILLCTLQLGTWLVSTAHMPAKTQ